MPRAINLAAAPPPQATCYACERTVVLDRRARSREAFRCPFCHTDNRVDSSGIGWPLKGPAERVDEMAQVRCGRCHTPNRVPFNLIRIGRYTCHHCRANQRVPRLLRRRADMVPWWQVGIAAVLVLGCFAYSIKRTTDTIDAFRIGHMHALLAEAEEHVSIDSARWLGSRADGNHFEVQGRMRNTLDRPTTVHIKVELLSEDEPIASRVVSLVLVPAGEERTFRAQLVDPRWRKVTSVGLSLVGVS